MANKKNQSNATKQQKRAQRIRKAYAISNTQSYYAMRDASKAAGRKGDPNAEFILPADKEEKKGKDYFFIMRKFDCFLMFLFLLVAVALFAISYLAIVPEYTSFAIAPDLTPEEERIATEVDGVLVDYVDKSEHFSVVDPVIGLLKRIPVVGDVLSSQETPFYDSIMTKVDIGYTNTIAGIAAEFFPIAMILFVILALIYMIKAFFGMFGKRIFKRFGLGAILMLICGAVSLFGIVAANMDVTAEALDFSGIVTILMGGISSPDPATAPTYVGGFGLLALLALPVLVLILSMFARKKVPFSIFD